MEDDNLNLEDSLKSYEKGIKLVKTAQESLKKIEATKSFIMLMKKSAIMRCASV